MGLRGGGWSEMELGKGGSPAAAAGGGRGVVAGCC